MLSLSFDPNKCVKIQKPSFHTSPVANRYGRQNKNRPRKNFFRPNWRYLLNLQNLLYHGLDGDNQFNKVLPYFSLPNYPIGDSNIRRRKELVAPFDEVKAKYFKLFPDDRMTYLYDATSKGVEWYKTPVDRFVTHIARHLAYSEKEITMDEAFDLALKDKKYEEEARKIEFQVQKQQAEALFGYQERDWLKEQNRGNQFEEKFDHDPREEEKIQNIKEQKLITLVHQRMIDPKKHKIRLADTQMTFYEVIKWLTVNPDYKQYFHESIYWGDVPYHELFLEDAGSVEAEEGDQEGDEGKYADPELDEEFEEKAEGLMIDKEKKKLTQAKQALENDTLLEDLNSGMSFWAKDLLDYFSDKTNVIVDEHNRKEACAAVAARNDFKISMGTWVETALDRAFVSNADIFPDPTRLYKDGADEVLKDKNRKPTYVSTTLEDELANLFRNVPKQDNDNA